MTAGPARARILVAGIVQGVGYRQSAAWEADRLGLAGWVRNLHDGKVEVLAEGPRDRVESLVAWCWRGPPAARVSDVRVDWSPAAGDLQGFGITY
ncbi:MAG TPA: acylphosphatase [Anaeromyxobacteraceae bacterium]|nr:acylphosphatase [Anaeromyxobacteraceae bacterium]